MFEVADTGSLARCHYFRTVCRLPVHIDDNGRLALTIGAGIRALTTPERLGSDIRSSLAVQGLLGPIIWHRSRRYTFLVSYSPDVEDNSLYSAVLLRTNSLIIPSLGVVALPSPGDDGTYRRWVHPARDGFRPAMKTVLDALIECSR